jgi:hypothetical protein
VGVLVISSVRGPALGVMAALLGADERRGEADLAAAMARLLPLTDDLRSALPGASGVRRGRENARRRRSS